MQLQQIAPHTNVTDGPADMARSAPSGPGGEAFGSVFSKNAAAAPGGPGAGQAPTAPGEARDPSAQAIEATAPGKRTREDTASQFEASGPGARATRGASHAAGDPTASGTDSSERETRGHGADPDWRGHMVLSAGVPGGDPALAALQPDKGPHPAGEDRATAGHVEAGQAAEAADLAGEDAAQAVDPEGLSFAGVQIPAQVAASAGSPGAGQAAAQAPGTGLSAGVLIDGPPVTARGSDIAPAGGQVSGGSRVGARSEGTALAGGVPGRGVTAPLAGTDPSLEPGGKHGVIDAAKESAQDSAKQPGLSATTVPTGAATGSAREGASGASLPGGLQPGGSTGMLISVLPEVRPSANGQVPVRIGAEGTAAPAGGAEPEGGTATAQAGIAASAPAAGAPEIQPTAATAATATAERQGPRAEGRAAETAHAAANATGQSTPAARSATGPRTMMAGEGDVRGDAGASVSRAAPVGRASGEGLFGADPLATEFGAGEIRGTDRSPATAPPVLPASVPTPRHVTLQIAEMVRTSGERAVELRLHPEELGRVQMTLSQDATGTLTVALTVERPETLDLLRRNIDLLGADLRALGYENVDFSFQGDGAGTGAGAGPDGGAPQGTARGPMVRDTDMTAAQAAGPQLEGRGAGAPGDGIDIRL